MSKHVQHVPKHRGAPPRHALVQAPRKVLRTSVILSSVAVAATGATISGGLLTSPVTMSAADGLASETPGSAATGTTGAELEADLAGAGDDSDDTGADAASEPLPVDEVADRAPVVSRSSDRREPTDPLKEAALSVDGVKAVTGQEDLSDADPREIGKVLLAEFGFSADQFGCLDRLFVSESNWRVDADNPTSSAYGIPQALTQLHDLPDDYMTNPVTQIRWGLEYIERRYGSPCSAWAFKQGHNWY